MFATLTAIVSIVDFFGVLERLGSDLDRTVRYHIMNKNRRRIVTPSKGEYTIHFNKRSGNVEITLHRPKYY